jgi:hypothetical protein
MKFSCAERKWDLVSFQGSFWRGRRLTKSVNEFWVFYPRFFSEIWAADIYLSPNVADDCVALRRHMRRFQVQISPWILFIVTDVFHGLPQSLQAGLQALLRHDLLSCFFLSISLIYFFLSCFVLSFLRNRMPYSSPSISWNIVLWFMIMVDRLGRIKRK